MLLIGLDGFEPSLARRWMDEGRLPHLARLRDQGAFVPVASTVPPATFPAWTSCVTGVNPGRHGVFDFTEVVPGQHALRFVDASRREAPALWDILSGAGKRVCVLGVPATYPPGPVNGIMVSGFDSPVCTEIDRSFVWPADAYEQVKGWRFADFQETDIGPGWHTHALPRLLDGIAEKETIAASLLAREAWDFFMVVFGESDTVAHHFWMFHDSNSPRHRPGPPDAVRRVYERLDQAVGKLRAVAGDDVVVGVVSDHGFGGAGTGVLHLNNWLAEQGYLAFSGAGPSFLKSAALALTPERLRGALFRRFGSLAAHAESRSRFGGIDRSRTRAWSEELNYFPSIRISVDGRDPQGLVKASDYEPFRDELCAQLEAWGPVRKAWRREDLYDGPYVERAPDIVLELELENGYSYSCLRGRGGPSTRRLSEKEHVGAKERGMNGTHRSEGVLFLSETLSQGVSAARMVDVAPTVLDILRVAGPTMDGASLVSRNRPTPVSAGPTRPDAPISEGYTPAEERVVEARLRALGYLE